ncbi:MAG: ATP-binding cassette domain-containing protein [Deltaproteobacteria bacterium]|nr:ATP-binding cassette domain-containing protein [Candidatus Zymogenaceae bacterium]
MILVKIKETIARIKARYESANEVFLIYQRLLGYIRPYRVRFSWAILMNMLYSATSAGVAYLIQPLMAQIIEAKDLRFLTLLVLAVVLTNILRAVVNFFGTYLLRMVGLSVVRDVRNHLYGHIQKLSLKFFSGTHTGVLTSRITNDVNLITVSVNAIEGIVKDPLTILGLIIVAFTMDPKLALFTFVVLPFIAVPVSQIAGKVRKFSTRGQVKAADITTILMETFSGARIVKAFGMEKYETERFEQENFKLFKTLLRSARVKAMNDPIIEVFATVGLALVLTYGGYQSFKDKAYFSHFISFSVAIAMIWPSIRSITKIFNSLQEAIAAAVRIFDVLDTKAEIFDKPDALELQPIKKNVELSHVSFAYDDEPVLRDINLKVKAGEVIAFVGMSGGGKTTLVNLIPRFYDVTQGSITVDGTDIRDATVGSLRSQIGIVTQQTILFSDTIKNNIAYGTHDMPDKAIFAAARAANAHDFITRLPHGYDTMIGEQGMRLSGGERQRISIARAILKDAPILILDEATSSLDTESEQEVQKALENLMKGRTTFVIAHRLSTIKYANRIVVLVSGKIVEEGTHDELLAKSGEYKKLYDMQFRDTGGAGFHEPVPTR